MTAGLVAGSLVRGIALGLQFNPLTAMLGAGAAALLAGYPSAPDSRRPLAVGVLGLAWLAGDGARVGSVVESAGTGAGTAAWLAVAAWVLVGALVGYIVPALIGITVGRNVIRGTGWASAAVVALTVSGALALVAPALADNLDRML